MTDSIECKIDNTENFYAHSYLRQYASLLKQDFCLQIKKRVFFTKMSNNNLCSITLNAH